MSQNKFFVTFPYPYVNGRLHMGHLYTLSKLAYIVRFKRLQGDNVLFPFAFHGTGSPIVSCAEKLKTELESNAPATQTKALIDCEVEDLSKFIDPTFWITYFSSMAMKDLMSFDQNLIDFSKSFYTTNLNPYYDKFIKWQYNILNKRGLLIFGKYPVIYCPISQQSCSDHDRQSGEGVKPKQRPLAFYQIANVTDKIILTYKEPELTSKKVTARTYYQDKGLIIYLDSLITENFAIQNPEIKILSTQEINLIINQPIIMPNLSYYEPESKVITRFGCEAVVKEVDQWFINYGDPVWKSQTLDFISNKLQINEGLRKMMINTCQDLERWPFTRSKGLGTQFLGTGLVIDSLSDSTIYQALYPIYDLLTQIPHSEVDDNTFNQIYLDYPIPNGEHKSILERAKSMFKYWYPVDLVSSGADLANNHLIMSIYHHIAIWGSTDLCPKQISINGYLNLNGKKMSKSTGNFLTISNSLKKYSSSALSLVLADTVDGTTDGDFNEKCCFTKNNQLLKDGKFDHLANKLLDIMNRASHKSDTGLSDMSLSDESLWHSIFFDSIISDQIQSVTNDFLDLCQLMEFKSAVTIYYQFIDTIDLLTKLPDELLNPSIIERVSNLYYFMSHVFLGDYYHKQIKPLERSILTGSRFYYPMIFNFVSNKFTSVTLYQRFNPEKSVIMEAIQKEININIPSKLLAFSKYITKKPKDYQIWCQDLNIPAIYSLFRKLKPYIKCHILEYAEVNNNYGPDVPMFIK